MEANMYLLITCHLFVQLEGFFASTTANTTAINSVQTHSGATYLSSVVVNQPLSNSVLKSSSRPSNQLKSPITSLVGNATVLLKPSQSVSGSRSAFSRVTSALNETRLGNSSSIIAQYSEPHMLPQYSSSLGNDSSRTLSPSLVTSTIIQTSPTLVILTAIPSNILRNSNTTVSVGNNYHSTQILISASPVPQTATELKHNVTSNSSQAILSPLATDVFLNASSIALMPSSFSAGLTSSTTISSNVMLSFSAHQNNSAVVSSAQHHHPSSTLALLNSSTATPAPNLMSATSSNAQNSLNIISHQIANNSSTAMPASTSSSIAPNSSNMISRQMLKKTSSIIIASHDTSFSVSSSLTIQSGCSHHNSRITCLSVPPGHSHTMQSHSVSPSLQQSQSSSPPTQQSQSASPPTPQSPSPSPSTLQSQSSSPYTQQSQLASPPPLQSQSASPSTQQSQSASNGTHQSSVFVSSTSATVSSVRMWRTSSVVYPKGPTKAAGTQEETHTPLIIGLAVGLSLGMILIVAIIVCYRRKRASYHYNVFYDEQNIVMNAFDSK